MELELGLGLGLALGLGLGLGARPCLHGLHRRPRRLQRTFHLGQSHSQGQG